MPSIKAATTAPRTPKSPMESELLNLMSSSLQLEDVWWKSSNDQSEFQSLRKQLRIDDTCSLGTVNTERTEGSSGYLSLSNSSIPTCDGVVAGGRNLEEKKEPIFFVSPKLFEDDGEDESHDYDLSTRRRSIKRGSGTLNLLGTTPKSTDPPTTSASKKSTATAPTTRPSPTPRRTGANNKSNGKHSQQRKSLKRGESISSLSTDQWVLNSDDWSQWDGNYRRSRGVDRPSCEGDAKDSDFTVTKISNKMADFAVQSPKEATGTTSSQQAPKLLTAESAATSKYDLLVEYMMAHGTTREVAEKAAFTFVSERFAAASTEQKRQGMALIHKFQEAERTCAGSKTITKTQQRRSGVSSSSEEEQPSPPTNKSKITTKSPQQCDSITSSASDRPPLVKDSSDTDDEVSLLEPPPLRKSMSYPTVRHAAATPTGGCSTYKSTAMKRVSYSNKNKTTMGKPATTASTSSKSLPSIVETGLLDDVEYDVSVLEMDADMERLDFPAITTMTGSRLAAFRQKCKSRTRRMSAATERR